MLEAPLIFITLALMTLALLLIFIPAVPVSALEWAIAMVYGTLTGFTRLTPAAALLITVFMVIGSTSAFWMPFFGLRGKSLSCLGLFAFFVGMALGTALLPIPFVGTIAGGVIGVMLVEFARIQEWRRTIQSGSAALRLVVYGMLAELGFAVAIVLTTIVSIFSTHAG